MLREKCNRPMLIIKRQRAILLEVYKCIHKFGSRYLQGMFFLKDRDYDHRDISIIRLPRYYVLHICIAYDGAKFGNSVSTVIKAAENVQEYSESIYYLIKSWDGKPCICRNCIICTIACM